MGASAKSPANAGLPPFRKDASLDRLAERFNVAQFVSFAPSSLGPQQQFSRLADSPANTAFGSVKTALEALFQHASEGTINIRSYNEDQPQSREFLYGLKTVDEALAALTRLSSENLFTIANETIDVSDGGVSGVAMGEIVEFGPDTTPRGVERGGFASLPSHWASTIFSAVYGVSPDFDVAGSNRVEFSLHPAPRGFRRTSVLYWELSESEAFPARLVDARWPNDFSRMVGDKAYGLLVAWAAGLPIPRTTVIGRRVAPFSFGADTGSNEVWLRTCPREQQPGLYTTVRGWQDPFALLAKEDPSHTAIASVLSQQAVPAAWSGAAIETTDGALIVEGIRGSGDALMLGAAQAEELPRDVRDAIVLMHSRLKSLIGDVRFEWVFDGEAVWLVQLHRGATSSIASVIVPGEAEEWTVFHLESGLEALRELLGRARRGTGVLIDGPVGLTSHIADVARKAGIPTRIRIAGG